MKRNRFDIVAILIVNFTGALGFSLVIPILVFLVTRFGGNAFMYGVVGALYSFCTLLAAPFLGRWSDRYGRKRIILLSQIGTLIGWLILMCALFLPITKFHVLTLPLVGTFTLTVPLLVLIFARCVDGITAGDIAAAQAYVADISEESERSHYYGLLSVAANIGFVVGPAFAGILASTIFHEKLPIFMAIIVSFVALTFVKLFFARDLHQTKRNQRKNSNFSSFKSKNYSHTAYLFCVVYWL